MDLEEDLLIAGLSKVKEKFGDRILEVGAGTGIYSLGLAKDGYQVDAVELVKDNLIV